MKTILFIQICTAGMEWLWPTAKNHLKKPQVMASCALLQYGIYAYVHVICYDLYLQVVCILLLNDVRVHSCLRSTRGIIDACFKGIIHGVYICSGWTRHVGDKIQESMRINHDSGWVIGQGHINPQNHNSSVDGHPLSLRPMSKATSRLLVKNTIIHDYDSPSLNISHFPF